MRFVLKHKMCIRDRAGAKNAAILAAQMIALSDDEMAEKMEAFKKAMAEKVIKDSVIEVE